MRFRRLFAIAAALSLLACMAAIALLFVEITRSEREKRMIEARLPIIEKQVQDAERVSSAYSDKLNERLRHGQATLADVYTERELSAKSQGLLWEEVHLGARVASAPVTPPVYAPTIAITAILPIVWLLWWSWRRRHCPCFPNLPDDERRLITREVHHRKLHHWQTWLGLLIAFGFGFAIMLLRDALWPHISSTGLGRLTQFSDSLLSPRPRVPSQPRSAPHLLHGTQYKLRASSCCCGTYKSALVRKTCNTPPVSRIADARANRVF